MNLVTTADLLPATSWTALGEVAEELVESSEKTAKLLEEHGKARFGGAPSFPDGYVAGQRSLQERI